MSKSKSWASSDAARSRMQANKSRDTGPELAIRRELHRLGFRYYVHRRPIQGLRRTADIVFPRARVAVFIDGCFWHGCPQHHTIAKSNAEYWAKKVRDNQASDEATDAILTQAGWIVIRVWEHVAAYDAVARIGAELSDRPHGAPLGEP